MTQPPTFLRGARTIKSRITPQSWRATCPTSIRWQITGRYFWGQVSFPSLAQKVRGERDILSIAPSALS